jgi:hypothetical protein
MAMDFGYGKGAPRPGEVGGEAQHEHAKEFGEELQKAHEAAAAEHHDARRTTLLIGMIVVLVVGAAGGYFLRLGTEPAPPAVDTWAKGSVFSTLITFDGHECMYKGPSAIPKGVGLNIQYMTTVKGSRLLIWKVEPGTTWGRVNSAGDLNNDSYAGQSFTSEPASPGEELRQVALVRPGTGSWVVSCTTGPRSTAPWDIVNATMVWVSD